MQTKQIIAKSREVHSPVKIDIKCKQKAYFWEDIYLALWMKSLDQNQIAERKIGGNIQNTNKEERYEKRVSDLFEKILVEFLNQKYLSTCLSFIVCIPERKLLKNESKIN